MTLIRQLRILLQHARFRTLLGVRLLSQTGDGLFQAGLASLFFFSPERLATATDVALAFTVLLLPFTVVGPFAGPLLDRWRRRQVLVWANTLRAGLAVAAALVMMTTPVGLPVYVLALVTLGVNRFLLSALSAGMPRVVPRHLLLMANSVTPSLGAVAAGCGAVIGVVLGLVLPPGPIRDGGLLFSAATVFLAAALAARRFQPNDLGPDRGGEAPVAAGAVVRTVLADLGAAIQYLLARRTPAAALAVMAAHRFLYGVNFLILILASRNLLSDPADPVAGLALFGFLTGISFAGFGLAIVATPIVHQRIRPRQWIIICLLLTVLSQMLAATLPRVEVLAGVSLLVGFAVQGAKIAVDTIVHRDTADGFRGRAFALYDVMFNAAFVGAAALAATGLPDTGWSRTVFLSLAAYSGLLAVAYRASARTPAAVS